MEVSFPITGFDLVVPSGNGRLTKVEFVSDNSLNRPDVGYEIVISIESANPGPFTAQQQQQQQKAQQHHHVVPVTSYVPAPPASKPVVLKPNTILTTPKSISGKASPHAHNPKSNPVTVSDGAATTTPGVSLKGKIETNSHEVDSTSVDMLQLCINNDLECSDGGGICFASRDTVWKSNSIHSNNNSSQQGSSIINREVDATGGIADVFGKDLVYEPSRKNNRKQHNQFLNSNYTKSIREWKLLKEGSKEVLCADASSELVEVEEVSEENSEASEGGGDMAHVLVEAAKSMRSDDSNTRIQKIGTARSRIDKATTAVQFLHGNYMQSRKNITMKSKGSEESDRDEGGGDVTDDSHYLLKSDESSEDDLDSEGGFDIAQDRVAAIQRAASTRLELPPLTVSDDDVLSMSGASTPTSLTKDGSTNGGIEAPTCIDSGFRRPKPKISGSKSGSNFSKSGLSINSNSNGGASRRNSQSISQETSPLAATTPSTITSNNSHHNNPSAVLSDESGSSGIKDFLPSVGSLLIERN